MRQRPWRPLGINRIRKPCDARVPHYNGRAGSKKHIGTRVVRRAWPMGPIQGYYALLRDVVELLKREGGVE